MVTMQLPQLNHDGSWLQQFVPMSLVILVQPSLVAGHTIYIVFV